MLHSLQTCSKILVCTLILSARPGARGGDEGSAGERGELVGEEERRFQGVENLLDGSWEVSQSGDQKGSQVIINRIR